MRKTHILEPFLATALLVSGASSLADEDHQMEAPRCDEIPWKNTQVSGGYSSALARTIKRALGKIDKRQKKFCEDIEISHTNYKKYSNCSDREIRSIQNRQYQAYDMISYWLKKIKIYEQWGANTEELKRLTSTLKCIAKEVSKVTFKCHTKREDKCSENTLAYVINTTLKIGNIEIGQMKKRKIYLCPGWSGNRVDELDTIIHEISHICGTTDEAYFNHRRIPKNVKSTHWSNIASTYGYWVTYGFCIPGIDC